MHSARGWRGFDDDRIGETVSLLSRESGGYDPDTIEQDPSALQDIARRFDGKLCLNARVVRAGTVQRGDAVRLGATAALYQS